MAFDDCAGNEDVAFLVSHADFAVDENLRLVVRQDVPYGGPVTMAVHAAGSRADDVAAVEVKGRPPMFTPTQVSQGPSGWFGGGGRRTCVCVCTCGGEEGGRRTCVLTDRRFSAAGHYLHR